MGTADFRAGFPAGDAKGLAPLDRNGFGKSCPCENPPWEMDDGEENHGI